MASPSLSTVGCLEILQSTSTHFHQEVTERYKTIAQFFVDVLHIDLSAYLENSEQFNAKEILRPKQNIDKLTEFENLRLNKPDAETSTFMAIYQQMNRKRFQIRPIYQREEVINRQKSSAIIESMLGIKLPPIFLYKRKDGVSEVIDGQQRLLSIIGFTGLQYLDENGEHATSEKDKFALKDLRILSDLNGSKFDVLTEDQQNRIYDFELSLVTIDEKLNEGFQPIDLFIRLNNKPYPIRDNTFEMWKSQLKICSIHCIYINEENVLIPE